MPWGESSKRAERPRNERLFLIRVSTIEELFAKDVRGGVDTGRAKGLAPIFPSSARAGELSGEREGKETSDFAEFGMDVTMECFRDLDRPVADLHETFES